jgi:hypothetical protein
MNEKDEVAKGLPDLQKQLKLLVFDFPALWPLSTKRPLINHGHPERGASFSTNIWGGR